PLAAEVVARNQHDVAAARDRAAHETGELVARLAPDALRQIKDRLRALVSWIQRYYGVGATSIQLVRGQQLSIEAARNAGLPLAEGRQVPREATYCDDVIVAGSTVVLTDPLHHPLQHFSAHPEVAAGVRFYAGVPLTTWSGVVIGSMCMV